MSSDIEREEEKSVGRMIAEITYLEGMEIKVVSGTIVPVNGGICMNMWCIDDGEGRLLCINESRIVSARYNPPSCFVLDMEDVVVHAEMTKEMNEIHLKSEYDSMSLSDNSDMGGPSYL